MKPPIVIAESYDISIHPTVRKAVEGLEPVDVRDGIYAVYDCDGHRLDLRVESAERQRQFLCFKWRDRGERIVLSEPEPPIDDSAELRSKLMNRLIRAGSSEQELSDVSLEELIKRVERAWPWPPRRSRP